MYSSGATFGLGFFWGLHVLSMLAFSIGVLFLVFWSFKHLSAKEMWKWGWILVAAGFVGCLITLSVLSVHTVSFNRNAGGMMANGPAPTVKYDRSQQNASVQPTDPAAQAKEEAEGKALYNKLKAKTTACSDLADSDFELIGEYLMGLRLGASHDQMNQNMQRMMGPDGERQMHITLAKNQTGCAKALSTSSK